MIVRDTEVHCVQSAVVRMIDDRLHRVGFQCLTLHGTPGCVVGWDVCIKATVPLEESKVFAAPIHSEMDLKTLGQTPNAIGIFISPPRLIAVVDGAQVALEIAFVDEFHARELVALESGPVTKLHLTGLIDDNPALVSS